MTYRIEEKIIIDKNHLHDFKNWINSFKGKKIYPDRLIESIYFENLNNKMFIDSEEGCVPRKKIRVRNYPKSQNKNFFFEKKITGVEGRFKNSKIINKREYEQCINSGYFDESYGLCFPKIKVKYYREYFFVFNSRITVDQKINYSFFKNTITSIEDNEFVIEIKQKNQNIDNNLNNIFPFQRFRFSKYCRAFNFLNADKLI